MPSAPCAAQGTIDVYCFGKLLDGRPYLVMERGQHFAPWRVQSFMQLPAAGYGGARDGFDAP